MNDEKILELFDIIDKLNRKIDRLSNLVTKMGKALHLVPVTEKEERAIQLLQRSNMATAAKVSEEIAAMSPKEDNLAPEMLTVFDKFENAELFGDVLGDDFLGGFN